MSAHVQTSIYFICFQQEIFFENAEHFAPRQFSNSETDTHWGSSPFWHMAEKTS